MTGSPHEELNERLVALLRRDGRAPIVDLAAELGVPRSVVRARLRELRESGDVAIVAMAHPAVLDLDVGCHLSIKVDGSTQGVVEHLLAADNVTLVSLVSGEYHIVVELRARDQRELFDAVEEIRLSNAVSEVCTLVYVDVLRSPFAVAARPAQMRLDEVDVAIVHRLQDDGRMPFRELAEAVGVSESTARTRTLALLEREVMRISTITRRGARTRNMAMGLGLHVRGYSDDLVATILEIPGVEFLATTIGNYDMIGTVSGNSLPALQRVAEQVRSSPDVTGICTWVHLDFVRETYRLPLGNTRAPVGE
ncbi:Lrp/AsnC family transcriptional regulator [Actinoplanes couchii]|uniref:AsnC family transcriptional regulator n=1 Tax=Actinoplanes couchii TaxID=403638 RepID=A0ABQ3XI53_9ACTN|nr:Lrp/AsnC family transcriptional regulator [Actinoplanes couchii]MDR6324600.1 DNA-binding Lrp family transcriptional regulator [Actinoplanes couchii]GID58152.1 AsnC family transcriptional regulator [Actinoplanes couchii]